MSWETSDRRDRLPPDWPKLRSKRLKIDGGRCTWRLPSGKRCPRDATDVDHRVNDDNHAITNLQSLCADHHAVKTSSEARAGKAKRKAAKYRPREVHPGTLGK